MNKSINITETKISKLAEIKKVCFFTVAITIIIILNIYTLMDNLDISKDNRGIFLSELTSNINNILLILIVILCLIYYYTKKNKDIFLIYLFYLSIFIDSMINNLNINGVNDIEIYYKSFIVGNIIRIILLLILFRPNEKIKAIITANEFISSIVLIVLSISLKNISSKIIIFINNTIELQEIYSIIVSFIIFFIIMILIITIIKYRGLNNLIYIAMLFNVLLLSIKPIQCHMILSCNIRENDFKIYYLVISIIAYMIIINTIVFKLRKYIRKNEDRIMELKSFHKITDEDERNIMILSSNREIIYNNKNMEHFVNNIIGKDDIYYNLGKLKRLYQEYYEDILSKLKDNDNWRGLIPLENGIIISCNVEKVIGQDKREYLTISCKDITNRYEINNQFKKNEERLRKITENIKELIMTIDMSGKIKYVNKSCTDTLGYDKSELINKNYKDVFDLDDKFKILSDNNEECKVIIDHEVRHKDGNKTIKLQSALSTITTDFGTIIGNIIVSRDMSYRAELELLKVKLQEAKHYEKIRNEFFANLSHELRTPINIIYSCLQLLNASKHKDSDTFVEYYNKYDKTFKQNCFRMLRLVNNLIDISRIDAGFMNLDIGNHDIIKLVEDITLSVIPYVESRQLDIVFDTDEEELEIQCDPDKLERVVLNLLSNAIKFTDIGGHIFVYISVDEDWVEISIKDDGIGIPPHMKGLVFERFVQTDKSFTRKKEGSGIGLALVKSIVELHEGNVFLKDSSELGSEFIIRLPNRRCNGMQKVNNDNGNKPLVDKISIEFADIYDIY